ncbi:hypothetical protein BDV96DRAFT_645084 [Lophiotrema nucula]|uniref:Uncharacterized protein n=1 Tax=Lophiotrema nucula TaxID=690887 RepID=A0A6A5ZAX5_9PLEO|nr:hypothetical protein BDV96DRAFT_645084 [Lophiotrema nucula]
MSLFTRKSSSTSSTTTKDLFPLWPYTLERDAHGRKYLKLHKGPKPGSAKWHKEHRLWSQQQKQLTQKQLEEEDLGTFRWAPTPSERARGGQGDWQILAQQQADKTAALERENEGLREMLGRAQMGKFEVVGEQIGVDEARARQDALDILEGRVETVNSSVYPRGASYTSLTESESAEFETREAGGEHGEALGGEQSSPEV